VTHSKETFMHVVVLLTSKDAFDASRLVTASAAVAPFGFRARLRGVIR
jgi:hypothetical protein